jgi:pimeloyl-ACP methyl ester carboxylesterase
MPTEPGCIDEILETDGGRRVGWLARGPEDGVPILYLHGCPGSRLEQRLIPWDVLSRFGARLISVDRPGYGNTDPLGGERAARVGDVLSVCDELSIDRFPAMGVSAGGSNVLTLAAIARDRVTRVISVSGQMPYDDIQSIATLDAQQARGLSALRAGRTSALEEEIAKWRASLLADPLGLFGSLATFSDRERAWFSQDWIKKVISADIREGVRPGGEGLLEDGLVCIKPFDVEITTVRCPVRAVHGSADDWEPLPNLVRVLEQITDTQLFVLDGLSHFGPLLYPDLLMSLALGVW